MLTFLFFFLAFCYLWFDSDYLHLTMWHWHCFKRSQSVSHNWCFFHVRQWSRTWSCTERWQSIHNKNVETNQTLSKQYCLLIYNPNCWICITTPPPTLPKHLLLAGAHRAANGSSTAPWHQLFFTLLNFTRLSRSWALPGRTPTRHSTNTIKYSGVTLSILIKLKCLPLSRPSQSTINKPNKSIARR